MIGIFEALRAFNSPKDNPPSFSERKRNGKCENRKVHLLLETTNDEKYRIDTISKVGVDKVSWWVRTKVFVLMSKRSVDYEFHQRVMERTVEV